MTHRSLFASGVLVLALALPVAASAQHGGPIEVPAVPSNLTVDAGNVPYLQTRAYGTQNYFCLPTHGDVAWKLFGPQATLYPGNVPLQIATHFLSPNPEEQGFPACDTWQHSHDGSAVWARRSAVDGVIELRRARRDSVVAAQEGRHHSKARSAERCWRRRRSFSASTRRAASRRRRLHDCGAARRDRARSVQHRLLLLSRGAVAMIRLQRDDDLHSAAQRAAGEGLERGRRQLQRGQPRHRRLDRALRCCD